MKKGNFLIMKKLFSLIKACMTDNMSLFRIKSKNQNSRSKFILPIVLFAIIFGYMIAYSKMIIDPLVPIHMEYVLLTLFAVFTTVMTVIQGIYKSSSLLFNSKDDNLLLSLPIKKSEVLFIRIFKFYVYEIVYNSLFLAPAMFVYAYYVNVGISYYLISILALLFLPIVPIIVSCILGGIISTSSMKFKNRNIAQTIITFLMLLLIFYASFNLENLINNISQNAFSINEIITKIYFPIRLYIQLVIDFSIINLISFAIFNLAVFVVSILIFSKLYFKINSNIKAIQIGGVNRNKTNIYKVTANKQIKSLIKKEFNRFINTPVFVINSSFGVILFIAGCIMATIKFDEVLSNFSGNMLIYAGLIKAYIPVILFGFICVSSLLSSITSSMISLEGKSFSILKSLPIKPFKIILAKILTALIIILPFLIIGDIIVFIKFSFSLIQIIMILVSSIIVPLVAETIGILVNLKYPKMDAENDTEVVKQSLSSGIAVFCGMILSGLSIFGIYKAISFGLSSNIIILSGLGIYTLICVALLAILNKISIKEFNKINV